MADDLDALCAEIEGPTRPKAKATTKRDDFDIDSLDTLVADLESGGISKKATITKKPVLKRKAKYDDTAAADGAELQSMLAGIETHISQMNLEQEKKGVCAFCNQMIFGDVTTIVGKTYHPEHVFCEQCGQREPNGQYYEHEGHAWCYPCYLKRNNMVCGGCGENILGDCMSALGKNFHEKCFVCSTCKKPFPGGAFVSRNGVPYCKPCLAATVVCTSCHKQIDGTAISALGGTFHKDCFACQICWKPFGPGFYQHEGLPYCEPHYLHKLGVPLCGGCNEAIKTGPAINALGKKWHPEHFVCSFCMTPLSSGYQESDGKPFCQTCYGNMF